MDKSPHSFCQMYVFGLQGFHRSLFNLFENILTISTYGMDLIGPMKISFNFSIWKSLSKHEDTKNYFNPGILR